MSKISLSPSPTGSAVYTIASPAGSTDRTLNLPDSAGTVATAESTLAQFSASGAAPVFAARAWVNFNGTGTVAIRSSGNVSSITDNGTGTYTVNFTTAMPDVNYVISGCMDNSSGNNAFIMKNAAVANTTSAAHIFSATTAAADSVFCAVAIFR